MSEKLNLSSIKVIISRMGVLMSLLVLCVLLSIISPHFLTLSNIMNVLLQVSTTTIVGVGMTLVILTGGIDLSVGSVVAISAASMAVLYKYVATLGFSQPVFILLGIVAPMLLSIVVGGIIGFVNGSLISHGKIPAFIATFGMLSIARGAAYIVTKSNTISVFPKEIRFLGDTNVGGYVPLPVIVAVLLVAISSFVLKYTKFGRYLYAFGGNKEALQLSGVNSKKIEVAVYTLCSLICGFAAIITVGKLNVASPITGNGYEMDAIGAVIVGGTSINGGSGTIVGTFIGALFIGTIRNGLNLMNVNTSVQPVVIGSVIIAAVLYDKYRKSKLAGQA